MKVLSVVNLGNKKPQETERRIGFDSVAEALTAWGVVRLALRDLVEWYERGLHVYPGRFFGERVDPASHESLPDQIIARRHLISGGNSEKVDPKSVHPFLTKEDSQGVRSCIDWGAASSSTIHRPEPNVVQGGAMLLKAAIEQADQALDHLTPQQIEQLAANPAAELPTGISEHQRSGGQLLVVAAGFYLPENDGPRLTIGGYVA
jgi:hypothetical protein